MHILILSDRLLQKELIQNGVSAYLHCDMDFTTAIPTGNELSEYDIVILWTHPGDLRDYSNLKQAIYLMQNFIHLEFPHVISYWERIIEATDAWGKPMAKIIKEHSDYFYPSKYQQKLLAQTKLLLSHETMQRIKRD